MKFRAKPHEIEAFQFVKGKIIPPKWFTNAYKTGRALVTMNNTDRYITVFNGANSMKAYDGQWVCINKTGTLFVLSDEEIKEQFDAVLCDDS